MSIKSALGWLALILFTTAAHAESRRARASSAPTTLVADAAGSAR